MTGWAWIPPHLAVSWHARLVEMFGGAPGIRDLGLLEGALARPQNLVAYGEVVTTERLAALYGVGVAKAHAFLDGNKRIAFAVMAAFLKAHGRHLDATEAEATQIMFDVAAGTMDETELEQWITDHCRERGREI
ncbi:Death-on-curing family protein [Magnetospirillum sp. LM-5]|uniref:type II toxin-antitoxin system death-on-curing family toxin n=1 Tax=Magnetospirillum sp. LM-5 TaxID=2681466 RepID=UPI0013862A66|nr:type II toxin-antitoxin system death-on-curing family toxin [Magnetospirillum sp. LM-5]CAA7623687.1 Death-on-curing family protein [Magnetospirillum sp. LM-5]